MSDGFSGRALRKLPFLAHAAMGAAALRRAVPLSAFLLALQHAVQGEIEDRLAMKRGEEAASGSG